MHILVVGRGIPSEESPLLGIFEFDQAKALHEFGLDVTFFAVDLRSIRRKRHFGVDSYLKDGVSCHSISVPVGAVPKSLLLQIGERALMSLYKRVFINNSPDIIHAHFTDIAYCCAKLAEKQNIPLVITEHSSAMRNNSIDKKLLNTAKYCYRRADRIIAVGNSLADNIYKATGFKSVIIPNVIGEDSFYSSSSNHNLEKANDLFSFVFTGNLITRKRPGLLIQAFSEVHKVYPNTRLGIIGDGELRPEIERELSRLNLEDSVQLFGRLSREQIARLYDDYDCFVLPSANETFGVVYIEAMAAGLPVIATECGGPEEFIGPEVGRLIPVDDLDALIAAMMEMVTGIAFEFDKTAIKQYVRDRFSPEVVSKLLYDIYSSVLKP